MWLKRVRGERRLLKRRSANMIGSWKLSAKGRTRTSTARLCWDIATATILGPDMIDVLPVALHRHRSPFFHFWAPCHLIIVPRWTQHHFTCQTQLQYLMWSWCGCLEHHDKAITMSLQCHCVYFIYHTSWVLPNIQHMTSSPPFTLSPL